MVRDTLRQSLASRLFWAMLALERRVHRLLLQRPGEGQAAAAARRRARHRSACPRTTRSSRSSAPRRRPIEGVDVLGGDELSLGFGAFKVATTPRQGGLRSLPPGLARGPGRRDGRHLPGHHLDGRASCRRSSIPNHATVLLAKPVPRWSLLLGKMLGVLTFVVPADDVLRRRHLAGPRDRTGVFDARYLLAIPVLLLHFTVFYSFSAMLAVWTRSTVVCVFGTLLFWVMCWGMNFGRHAVVAHDPAGMSRRFAVRPGSRILGPAEARRHERHLRRCSGNSGIRGRRAGVRPGSAKGPAEPPALAVGVAVVRRGVRGRGLGVPQRRVLEPDRNFEAALSHYRLPQVRFSAPFTGLSAQRCRPAVYGGCRVMP